MLVSDGWSASSECFVVGWAGWLTFVELRSFVELSVLLRLVGKCFAGWREEFAEIVVVQSVVVR